jgi:hypothetical protein
MAAVKGYDHASGYLPGEDRWSRTSHASAEKVRAFHSNLSGVEMK